MKDLVKTIVFLLLLNGCTPEEDNCIVNKCQNGGKCDDGECLCPPGYTGMFCQEKVAAGGGGINSTAPTIASFSPNFGSSGTVVTISGNNLNTASTVTIGGYAARILEKSINQIRVEVGDGGSGPIQVTADGGTVISSNEFSFGGRFEDKTLKISYSYLISNKVENPIGSGCFYNFSSTEALYVYMAAVFTDGSEQWIGNWATPDANSMMTKNGSIAIFTKKISSYFPLSASKEVEYFKILFRNSSVTKVGRSVDCDDIRIINVRSSPKCVSTSAQSICPYISADIY